MRIFIRSVVGATALAVILAFAGTADAQNKCLAGKIKCVSKKKSCLLGVEAKARKKGLAPDAAKLQKCIDKFDGGADPSKGCFQKLETKNDGPCITFGDTASMEAKIDAFVADVVDELDQTVGNDFNKCTAGKIKCVSKKDKCVLNVNGKAAKLGLPVDLAKLQKCFDKFDGGIDPTKGCFEKLEGKQDIAKPESICDTEDDTASMEAKIDAFDADVLAELNNPGFDMDTRRCTGNTRTKCNTNADCAVPGGTCQFYFGTYLSLAAGGVSTCVGNQWSGSLTGTFDSVGGSSAGTAAVISTVFSGPLLSQPCPGCDGDGTKNDNVRGGTCDSGQNSGQTCDVNGSITGLFDDTSLDCPPLSGGLIATLPIDLTNTTGTVTRTLSAASPNCRAPGFTALECFCDTCNNGNAEPCDDNGDCPDPPGPTGPICGGRRCVGGGNSGAACTVNSECPGGACGVPGAATAPNQCDDATCSPDGGNEGTCSGGPFELFCAPKETFRGCTTNADCPFAGDTCSLGKFRDCFTDNGTIGESVSATGVVDPFVNHANDPTFASLFCIGPTSSSSVNAAAGLSGLGRLELPGHGSDNGTAGSCPTTAAFLPDAGTSGVLDPGWTGQGHDARVVSDGKVTVGVTGCANGTPPCGVCTYTGPIPNENIAP